MCETFFFGIGVVIEFLFCIIKKNNKWFYADKTFSVPIFWSPFLFSMFQPFFSIHEFLPPLKFLVMAIDSFNFALKAKKNFCGQYTDLEVIAVCAESHQKGLRKRYCIVCCTVHSRGQSQLASFIGDHSVELIPSDFQLYSHEGQTSTVIFPPEQRQCVHHVTKTALTMAT